MTDYLVRNPATGQVVRRYPTALDEELYDALHAGHAAYTAWRNMPLSHRATVLRAAAKLYRSDARHLADLAREEMGKTTSEALGEVELVARICDYYAENGPSLLKDREIHTRPGTALVKTRPVGVLLGIMPWNYPYYQLIRFAAPNILLGNAILLKPAPSCPSSAESVREIFERAGLPKNVFADIRATNEQVAALIAEPEIQGVSFTGSERGGREVAECAGKWGKKIVLELGGSDPFIVLPDADIDKAVEAAVFGRMQNAGQACSASKRFYIADEIYDEFVDRFVESVKRIRVGDPADPQTTMGPLVSEEAAARVLEQLADAVKHGASVLVGGGQSPEGRAFIEPAILTGVTEDMRAYHEEIFGPVAVVHRVRTAEEAVSLANASHFGLGSVIFGNDQEEVSKVAEGLDVGMVAINGPSLTQEDTPFGGVKGSGFGRELGEHGLFEFSNQKLVRSLR